MLTPYVIARKLAPRSLSNLPHILVLLHRAVHVTSILRLVTTPKAHHSETTDDECTGAEDDKEYDQGWGNLESHIISFIDVHGGERVAAVTVKCSGVCK